VVVNGLKYSWKNASLKKKMFYYSRTHQFLDAVHVEWLMKFLSNYKNGFIVISHNTEFLNGISTVIVALENNKL
jgi:hypothetical protein